MSPRTATRKTAALPVSESSVEDLAVQRHLLDLALQPLDRFDGFNQIEQFGSSALRYQLNFINYALCMAQYTRTPAFTGYLAEAQRNAIVKMTDKRVWGYWAKENLIGYGRLDPDPIVKNNVMYTAFFGTMLGLYETVNADRSLSESGALTLVWDKNKSFAYDFGRIAEAIARNMRSKPGQPQYPCEPHLVYPMCNAYAITTLLMHDRLHATELTGDLVDQLRESYHRDGWLRKDGRFIGGGTRGGKQIFPPYLGNDASVILWMNAYMPDLSEDCWAKLRAKNVVVDDEGKVHIKTPMWDKLDFGNYSMLKGSPYTYASLMAAARELGDDEAATALARAMESKNKAVEQNGARKFEGVSVWANAFYALARFLRPGAARDLVHGKIPAQWTTGPVLADAAYPDVLVARAVSNGRALELVLRAGDGARRTTLAIERLAPDHQYALDGAVDEQVVADAHGRALIEIDLADRVEVRLRPRQ